VREMIRLAQERLANQEQSKWIIWCHADRMLNAGMTSSCTWDPPAEPPELLIKIERPTLPSQDSAAFHTPTNANLIPFILHGLVLDEQFVLLLMVAWGLPRKRCYTAYLYAQYLSVVTNWMSF